MRYVYPKFSKYELIGVRFSGAGLGNLLFIYSRAMIYAEKNDCKMIWPTWFSIRLGSWIRNETDKRTYHNLFCPADTDITGVQKYFLLWFQKKDIKVMDYNNSMIMSFDDLKGYESWIYQQLVRRLQKKSRSYLKHDFSDEINVHVRLGDFSPPSDQDLDKGYNSIATSIDWFVAVINELYQITNGKVTFNIFSDGTEEELKSLLTLPNVKRLSFGTSIADLLALSKTKVIVASGSSFSLWSRFLGQQSCIAYYKQLKQMVISNPQENDFEVELSRDGKISGEIQKKIKKLYNI